MKDFSYLQQKYIISTYPDRGLTFVRGDGVYLYDTNNDQYLDLMTNYGVSILGYNHPVVTKALIDQVKNLMTLHGSFNSDTRSLAAEALIKRCGEGYVKVSWSSSGAEAIEAALKFSVLVTGKKKFIVCKNGYHGKTLGALSATTNEKYKKPFEPLLWEFIQIPFNDSEALKSAIDENVAAFIVEPIQGESGILTPDDDYLKKVREICTEKNVLLILDEIQTGNGRTGTFLRSEKSNIAADILCLGKGLAGGIPIGATIVSQKVSDGIPKHVHTSTLGGNPLMAAGVLSVLSALDEKLLTHVGEIGEYFCNQLREINSPKITAVRGVGLMIGLEVSDKRNVVLKLLQDEKILAIPAGENVVRFLPPFLLEKENVDTATEKIKLVLEKI